MAVRTFTANFVGRTTNLEKSFKRVAKGSSLMSDKLMKATRMAGIGFGALAGVAVGAAAALKPMIDKAASMEESLSKNRVVFGESSKAIEAFAETSLHSFGVTERAALEATGVIGTLGTAMGMTASDSAEMATTLVGLAGDMSSFNDASVEETLTAIQAGLRGEAEPLRRFGVLLDAATLKAKALQKGIITSTKEALTPQQKALAAYAVILEQTTVQMGDFERTADSATNQSKLLAGEWDAIQTQIGTALLPAFTAVVTHLNDEVMPSLREFFEDPGWAALGELAGEAITSEFSKKTVAVFEDGTSWFINPIGSAIQTGIPVIGNYFFGAGTDARTSFQRGIDAAEGSELGRLNPDWDRGDWETAGSAAGAVFYGAAGAMVPSPLIPPGAGVVPPAGPPIFGPPGTPPGAGGGFVPPAGPPTGGPPGTYSEFSPPSFTTGDELDAFYATLGITPSTPPAGSGHPAGPTVNVVVNGVVSGQEVVDAIGKYVDGNGPLPPHWQQGAN